MKKKTLDVCDDCLGEEFNVQHDTLICVNCGTTYKQEGSDWVKQKEQEDSKQFINESNPDL